MITEYELIEKGIHKGYYKAVDKTLENCGDVIKCKELMIDFYDHVKMGRDHFEGDVRFMSYRDKLSKEPMLGILHNGTTTYYKKKDIKYIAHKN